MGYMLKRKYKLPKKDEIRLIGICDDIFCIIQYIKHSGTHEIQHLFRNINTKKEKIILEEEVFSHYDMLDSPHRDTFFQLLFNIELLYIKLYILDEAIKQNKKIPLLQIKMLKEFRLAFSHHSTGIIFNKTLPSIHHTKWFRKDFSEICFTFLGSNRGSKDLVMEILNDINKFEKWEEEVLKWSNY